MWSSTAGIVDTCDKVEGVTEERLLSEITSRTEIGGSEETKVHGIVASDEESDECTDLTKKIDSRLTAHMLGLMVVFKGAETMYEYHRMIVSNSFAHTLDSSYNKKNLASSPSL